MSDEPKKVEADPVDRLTALERRVGEAHPGYTADEWGELIEAVASAKERLKDLQQAIDDRMLMACEQNGPIVIGPIKYYAGLDKVTKCIDPRGALDTLLRVAEGDYDAVVSCLSSGAWKHGAVRSLLTERGKADEFPKLFSIEERPVLKEGSIKGSGKRLQKIDTRFLK